MSSEIDRLEKRIKELEAWALLSAEADRVLESLWRDRTPLRPALDALMPIVARHTGANRVEIRTLDEDLEWRAFGWGADAAIGTWLEESLDVAGVDLGHARLGFEALLSESEQTHRVQMLHVWVELLDNYLASIALFRLKHQLLQETSEALKDPILDRGIERALGVLGRALELDQLVVLFKHEDEEVGLRHHVLRPERSSISGEALSGLLRRRQKDLLEGQANDVMNSLGLAHHSSAPLNSGVGPGALVGRIYASSVRGELNRFERDLLESFAAFLLQRVVDFNREWKHLSLCFPRATVSRLLGQPGYREKFLSAGEHDIAIMFADISGFTRISEQVLKDPALIGRLIHLWSDHVVDRIWEAGAVFDKMVGDCVIALFGPPFYEDSPAELCRLALQVAEATRQHTQTLNDSDLFPELRGLVPPVGVAIGLNFCPAYVGHFGPNDGYTAFSAGMNNTARLQGLATSDEIAATESFIAALGEPERFGEPRSAKVKNVADALRYRVLR